MTKRDMEAKFVAMGMGDWFASHADAVPENMPSHIYNDTVSLMAIRLGAEPSFVESLKSRVAMGYRIGEPVWMVSEDLAFRAERARIHAAADKDASFLRGEIRRGSQERKGVAQ